MKRIHSIPYTVTCLATLVLIGLFQNVSLRAGDQIPNISRVACDTPPPGSSASRRESELSQVAPDEYVHLHVMAMHPDATHTPMGIGIVTQTVRPAWVNQYPHWTNAMARLGEMGDAYTLKLLDSVQVAHETKQGILTNTIERIQARLKDPSPWPVAEVVRARLERAAYADVTCSALEGTLVSWALGTTKSMRDQPEVKALLQQLRQETPKKDTNNVWRSVMAERVRNYAEKLNTP